MKGLLRQALINAFVFFLISQLLDGITITGGTWTYLIGGFTLTMLSVILKPILNLITLPIHAITLGAFSVVSNAFILYLVTVFLPQISIQSFLWHGISFAGVVIPQIHFNLFFACLFIAAIFSLLTNVLQWILEK